MKTFAELLAEGPQIGLSHMYPAPGIIERIGPDWDWIWIDAQHGELDYSDVLGSVRACNLIGKPAVVRVPGHEAGIIGKMLDTAADAIMVPVIDDAEQAAQAVQAVKFPPLGSRSFGGRRPIDLMGRAYANADHPQPLLICQIETKTAVENVEAIASVEGVDVLLFGPDDVALRCGLPMDKPRPKGYFDDTLKIVADVAQAKGKFAGGVFTTPEALSAAVELGYKLIVGTGDTALLSAGSQRQAQILRQCLCKDR